MNRYLNLIVLCLVILFVTESSLEPSNKNPRKVSETFVTAIKTLDFKQLEECFQPKIHARFLTPGHGFFENFGSPEVVGIFREMFSGETNFTIERSKVNQLGENKIHISYQIWLSSGIRYEQQIYVVIKEGLIETLNLLCSGNYKPVIAH